MSVGMIVGMTVLLIVVAIVAFVVGYVSMPDRKRFGLKEAEAAAQYVGNTPGAARPVMGVVLGVLGYRDAVAEDVSALVAAKAVENARAEADIAAHQAQIERLEQASEELAGEIAANQARVTGAERVAALFS